MRFNKRITRFAREGRNKLEINKVHKERKKTKKDKPNWHVHEFQAKECKRISQKR